MRKPAVNDLNDLSAKEWVQQTKSVWYSRPGARDKLKKLHPATFAEKDVERLFLRLDVALRGGYETRWRYFPTEAGVDPYGVPILAPRVAGTFRWSLNKHLRLSEELEFVPFLLAPVSGRLLINNTTKLNANVTETVALTAALVINYDSMPPPSTPAKLTTDVALTVGVEAAF